MNSNGMSSNKTLVIRNGTLIDGSGKGAARNETIVIEGTRIKSIGPLPPDVTLEDRRSVELIDAGGQWIMPGLIDAHCHVSYGYPTIKGEGKGKGTTRPEFSTLKSARSVQKVLRSGVTGISVPGGTWFTDVGVRDAIKLGLMAGPHMYVAGRMVVTYGCIEDDEPSWEGTPDHSIGKLCNTADEMVTEVRRQSKHGVNFIKMADSRSGESQMLAKEEIAAVVGEAHRRNLRVGIHSRGAGSTRAAAEAGVDWIIHADLATERDLEAVAKAGMPIIPTATFLAMAVELGQKVGAEQVQLDINRMKRHFDLLCELMHKARKLGIKLLIGTDTGNNSFMPHGELHAKELEVFVKHGGYTPMEAIVAATRDNAYAVGLEGQVGEVAPGKLADIIVLRKDPLADITVLQGGRHLSAVIKDGKIVDLDPRDEMLAFQQAAE
jgi:imidazolonepropionase-like amidohydrolase